MIETIGSKRATLPGDQSKILAKEVEEKSKFEDAIPADIYVSTEEKPTEISQQKEISQELTDLSWRQASSEQIAVRDKIKSGIEALGNKVIYIGEILNERDKRYLHVGFEGQPGLTRVLLDKDNNIISLTKI
ncbi:MAG: hypothetical protein WC523_07810 [Patescibacteria group bacterium]|jgi:hypothetical protein